MSPGSAKQDKGKQPNKAKFTPEKLNSFAHADIEYHKLEYAKYVQAAKHYQEEWRSSMMADLPFRQKNIIAMQPEQLLAQISSQAWKSCVLINNPRNDYSGINRYLEWAGVGSCLFAY
ncbi:hypothetical protein MGYG_01044 [Nannizzia gypsea CBS 118893]|uniref:Uncharacterized protein n=1 Tax=Arthroderma gypseum (strain ATCC MYA-4604 / CBS 118893) TaxID=535722 RepID=E5R3U8_ARTGP|nr:hypothetical protein MGYG_01044 [Nannizzia gypsea CBS 118893]EFQ98008.1 hypothetical protein MGYG_01044 [Nannizzia gypsea CBS 118893]